MDRQPDVRIGAIERTLQGVGNAVVALVAQHPDELGDEHVTHLDTPKPHAATKDTRSGRGERKGAKGGYALTSDVSKGTLGGVLLRMWLLLEIGDGTSVHVVSCAEITSL